ncbi:hypothetical protein FGO68_gene6566 [Halteria grandinella]|uniref:Uncharacterized protein n=1 Tax=Halteria grandinella TaxID=5974 RepID=A0A8J8P046_HALGN|nr:hypothetical protein FGO68_gene6566 [Halteria grandinella]
MGPLAILIIIKNIDQQEGVFASINIYHYPQNPKYQSCQGWRVLQASAKIPTHKHQVMRWSRFSLLNDIPLRPYR